MGAHPNPTTSAFRHAIERMDPDHYLASSYYEHWLTAAATIAVESGVATRSDLEARAGGPVPLARAAVQPVVEGSGQERFSARDLWDDADSRASVHVDLWDSYLEPA